MVIVVDLPYFFQIKGMIQSSPRNSILEIYGLINLCKPPLTNFGLIQFSAIPGMKPLSCPSHDIKGQSSQDNKGQSSHDNKGQSSHDNKGCQEQFPGENCPINVLLWHL